MQLKTTIENAPILSNVGAIGEFKIKSSAKAFQILSSGLYSNKIRAIIRELSCNAVDSHVAAGKPNAPITVHLPNQFEPYFSVTDYGIGLDNDQVVNIYTTYFESTKTESDDYIGALGLGSKSPFSYTDNFTVTAIKNNVKRIYSAFINAVGAPSIVLMDESSTEEHNGIEVKLAVTNTSDFAKFKEEAQQVFTYFTVKPKVIGQYTPIEIEYNTVDLMPGVSVRKLVPGYYGGNNASNAIMGNIAYPINIPNASMIGPNAIYLNQGLDIRFNIGDLDIQASREGLSYIPETIAAIKQKLEGISEILDSKFAERANAITNFWEQCSFLEKEGNVLLWKKSVTSYIASSKNPLLLGKQAPLIYNNTLKLDNDNLKDTYNIKITRYEFYKDKFRPNFGSSKEIELSSVNHGLMIINDLPKARGFKPRAIHNVDVLRQKSYRGYIFEISPYDIEKPMLASKFIKDIYDFPNVINASSLTPAPKKEKTTHVTINFLKLNAPNYYNRKSELVWNQAGDITTLDKDQTYYVVQLKGFQLVTKFGYLSFKDYYSFFSERLPNFPSHSNIIAVRGDNNIAELKKLSNIKPLDEHVTYLYKLQEENILQRIALLGVDNNIFAEKDAAGLSDKIVANINADSAFTKFWQEFRTTLQNKQANSRNEYMLSQLVERIYQVDVKDAATAELPYKKLIAEKKKVISDMMTKYPMFNFLDRYRSLHYNKNAEQIFIDYINLIDNQKETI